MRTKQLAAIVEPRPWWAPFIRIGARVSRYQLPVGAAAILALTFVTLREYRSADPRPVFEPAVAAAANLSPAASDAAALVSSDYVAGSDTASAPTLVESSDGALSEATETAPEAAPVETMVGASSHVAPVTIELTPSARYIAENFAAAREADPQLDRVWNRSVRTADALQRTEPLAQVNMPGESLRARLMGGSAWFASATSGTDSALRTDEHESRLTERRLSESEISRIDLGGARVTVKF
jgi:hypothetical protein